jgi:hypothetical protein
MDDDQRNTNRDFAQRNRMHGELTSNSDEQLLGKQGGTDRLIRSTHNRP